MPSFLLSGRQLLYALSFTVVAFLYKISSQSAPYLLAPSAPPFPSPNTCSIHHAALLQTCSAFAQIPESTLLVLSCDYMRRAYTNPAFNHTGSFGGGELWLYDYTAPEKEPLELDIQSVLQRGPFRPLGISAVRSPPDASTARIFVANRGAETSVEVLDVDLKSGATVLRNSVAGPGIYSPSGVAAVSHEGFFVTNDAKTARRSPYLQGLEFFSTYPGGSAVYVALDASGHNITAIDSFAFAAGVAVDRKAEKLYISSSAKGVYEYNYPSGNPADAKAVKFHRGSMILHNIVFSEETQTLYASGTSDFYAYIKSANDASLQPSGSWVVRLLPEIDAALEGDGFLREQAMRGVDVANSPLRKEEWRWRTVVREDGRFFGGLASAVVEGKRFVGVSSLKNGIMVCESVPVPRKRGKAEAVEKDEL